MDNRHETEEEMRARLKEEIKAELMKEMSVAQKEGITTGAPKENRVPTYQSKEETLRISRDSERGVKEATDLLNKDMTFGKKDDGPKTLHLPQSNDEETGTLSIVLVLVVVVLIVASYILIPKIYKWYAAKETPSSYVDPNAGKDEEPVVELENITLESNTVKDLTYPIMRNNPYTTSTYYTRDILNVGDMSNNDLLYNAFIHIYKGNIAEYTGAYSGEVCVKTDERKTFNANYIEARMDNLFTKSVDYEHKNFKVPSTNTTTAYVGTWKYDSKNHRYIYYGDCDPIKETKERFYNIEIAYDAKGVDSNRFIEVYYHMAFAKLNTSTNKYTIYSDAAMKKSILSGTLTSQDYESELKEIFKNYVDGQNTTSKYKYTFTNQDCSYQNYCFLKGEWIEKN